MANFSENQWTKMEINMVTSLNFLKKTSDKTLDDNFIKFKCFHFKVHISTFATTCHNVLKIDSGNFNLV